MDDDRERNDPSHRVRPLQPQLRAARRRGGRPHRGRAGRRDESHHEGLRLQQGVRHRPLRRARRPRAPADAPRPRRLLRADRLDDGDRRDRRPAERDPAAPLAARDRAGRHRRAGQPHGRALRDGLPPRHGLAPVVQRLRAGEDAAQPPRPVDVRRLAGELPARRHGAGALPPRARDESQDLQPRPQRDRHLGRPGGCMFLESFLPPLQDPARVKEPERALASGIPAIRALGNGGMFSPTLVPEEVLLDHPERIRALVVEGSNPILSYSDASRWREARERLDLLVVIDPAMTETARLADYVLPTPVGYEKWETSAFPRGVPEIYMQVRPPVVPPPPDALPEPEIYVRLCEAMGLYRPPPAELHTLATDALTPAGAMAFLGTAQGAARGGEHEMLVWAYRTLGPHLPSPALAAMFFIAHLNAMFRPDSVLRTLGPEWEGKLPFEIGSELFRRFLAHPEGVEIARQRLETNLEDHLGFADGKIRLAPEAMLPEIRRAIATAPAADPHFPFVLAAGLRTRWTANTIQRDPAWRKGKGPHCALNLSPDDARTIGVRNGDPVPVSTRRGRVTLPAQVDAKLMAGHVWMPNGFGMVSADGTVQGANQNELTDVTDRDPFTGIPHHRHVRCRVERAA